MENQTNKQLSPDSLLIHYLTLRKSVGILGIFLPLVLIFGVRFLTNCTTLQDSISDYYYTKMGHYMTGTLCAVSLFMFSYKGYGPKDLWAGRGASLFSLAVAFFPCSNFNPLSECKALELKGDDTINLIHFVSAACLFLIFSFFCLFLFTKSSGHPTNRKKQRNIVYRVCGITILLCIILILLYSVIPALHNQFKNLKPIFWLETLALLAFGFSWLTKGEGLLPDKNK